MVVILHFEHLTPHTPQTIQYSTFVNLNKVIVILHFKYLPFVLESFMVIVCEIYMTIMITLESVIKWNVGREMTSSLYTH